MLLADALAAAGNTSAASAMLEENLALGRKQLGEENLGVLRTRLSQARMAIRGGQHANGHAALAALIPSLRKQGKAGQLALGQALVLQGEALLRDGKFNEARVPLNEALQLRQTLLWEHSPDITEARKLLDEARQSSQAASAGTTRPSAL
jgi:eukaryotic-like serine/threonine-protein kinase